MSASRTAPDHLPAASDPFARPVLAEVLQRIAAMDPALAPTITLDDISIVPGRQAEGVEAFTTDGRLFLGDASLRCPVEDLVFALVHVALLRDQRGVERIGTRDPMAWNLALAHEVLGVQRKLGQTPPSYMLVFPELIGQPADDSYPEAQALLDARFPNRHPAPPVASAAPAPSPRRIRALG